MWRSTPRRSGSQPRAAERAQAALRSYSGAEERCPSVIGEAGTIRPPDTTVTPGSGNVFADLGVDAPEEAQIKAQLVREIRGLLAARDLTQSEAGALLGLAQSDVSAILNGRVHRFSLERLLRCVRRLGREVELVIRPARPAPNSDPVAPRPA